MHLEYAENKMFNKSIIAKSRQNLLRVLSVALILVSFSLNSLAQSGEHIVILWDVTGSLLPTESGQKTLGGKPLPAYSEGNGLFVPLQKAIIECIEYAEEDPGNEISIVPFNDAILGVITEKASETGKQNLKEYVTNFE